MMLTILIVFILIGIVAGLLAGLLGIGGGLISVPAMHFAFFYLGFPQEKSMLLAIGTSLGAMVFTASASAYSHYLKNGIIWDLFKAVLPGVIGGAVLGAFIADSLPGRTLEIIFGASICLIGFSFLLPRNKFVPQQKIRVFPGLYFIAGLAIGTISTILGIGGGILTVPYLTFIRIPLKNAISTSAALGFPIAFIGAISFLYLGLDEKIVEGSIGYLYLPGFFILAISSSLCAPLGAKMAYALPIEILGRVFGLVLIAVGLSMVL